MKPEMQQCIQNCLDCHATCLKMAMNHCLETGGKHTEPAHFRLMMDCVEICQTSANFMLRGSDASRAHCAASARKFVSNAPTIASVSAIWTNVLQPAANALSRVAKWHKARENYTKKAASLLLGRSFFVSGS